MAMHKATPFLFTVLLGIAALALTTSSGRAAMLLVDSSGQLTGATGVDVGGTLFDVAFVDGTCISVFNGCDADSDFPMFPGAIARDAALALLDQVFIDTTQGLFDRSPFLTSGCPTNIGCIALVPRRVPAPGFVATFGAENHTVETIDMLRFRIVTRNQDLSLEPEFLWAVFTQPTAIPEPGSLWLFGFGLAGLAGLRWRRRHM